MDAATRSRIRRASAEARRRIKELDAEARRQLRQIYLQARKDIERRIAEHAGPDGRVRLESLRRLVDDLNERIRQLGEQRDSLLGETLRSAADEGVEPFAGLAAQARQIADQALLATIHMVHADGLQLSDRLWRLDQHAREIVANQVEQAIIRGDSADRAARDFIARGLDAPEELQRKIGAAQAHRIAESTGRDLMRKGSPYYNALRVFRTEINRAHGEAYQAAAFDLDDVIGTRFLLSPNHPKPDICDMHARVNRYGLGPGVYPPGRNPWPAHPNTLSFVVAVFRDEITPQDRKEKTTRIEWLKAQSRKRQWQILYSRKKVAALHRGLLRENQIATPWETLKKRYRRQGIDTDRLELPDNA